MLPQKEIRMYNIKIQQVLIKNIIIQMKLSSTVQLLCFITILMALAKVQGHIILICNENPISRLRNNLIKQLSIQLQAEYISPIKQSTVPFKKVIYQISKPPSLPNNQLFKPSYSLRPISYGIGYEKISVMLPVVSITPVVITTITQKQNKKQQQPNNVNKILTNKPQKQSQNIQNKPTQQTKTPAQTQAQTQKQTKTQTQDTKTQSVTAPPIKSETTVQINSPPVPVPNYQQEFKQFKKLYNRNYGSAQEEKFRFEIFKKSLDIINNHNNGKGKSSYQMGINQFADMTDEQFQAGYLFPMDQNMLKKMDPNTIVNAPTSTSTLTNPQPATKSNIGDVSIGADDGITTTAMVENQMKNTAADNQAIFQGWDIDWDNLIKNSLYNKKYNQKHNLQSTNN